MKTLEELKEMIETAKDCTAEKEAKFLSYNIEDGIARLHNEYQAAKNYVDKGGQILVISTDKIYTYSIKNDEEYHEYLRNQIKYENYNKMNYYGL